MKSLLLSILLFFFCEYAYSQKPVNPKDYPGVLINGLYWSEYNVDAPGTFTSLPEEFGMLYRWNSQIPIPREGDVEDWGTSYDYWKDANNPCPDGWRLPTRQDTASINDLTKVDKEYTSLRGINGYRFTDKTTGNSIFFPMAGYREPSKPVTAENRMGVYWTKLIDYHVSKAGLAINFISSKWFFGGKKFSTASSVRCVRECPLGCECIKRDTSVTIYTKDLPYDFCDTTFKEGTGTGIYTFRDLSFRGCDSIVRLHLTVKPTNPVNPKEYPGVLINGRYWSEYNVGAPGTFTDSPEAYGMLYPWNSKIPIPRVGEAANSADASNDWKDVNNPCPAGWRLPKEEDILSIGDETKVDREQVLLHGINGHKFTDKSTGNSVFFPWAGIRWPGHPVRDENKSGSYWTSETPENFPQWYKKSLLIYNKAFLCFSDEYGTGLSIRCIREHPPCKSIKRDTSVTICAKDLPYDFCDTTFEEGTMSGTYVFQRIQALTGCDSIVTLKLTVKSECDKPCPGVLINGVCWAEFNVDAPGKFANAAKPYGMFYQWNRKKAWPVRGEITGWDNSVDPAENWEPDNDPCPAGWRMPTVEEMKKLIDESKVTYTTTAQDGFWGARFKDNATGKTIFFPDAGCRLQDGAANQVLYIYYWSGSSHSFLDRNIIQQVSTFAWGYSVRCVADEQDGDIVLALSETICQENLPYPWRDTTFGIGTKTGEYCFRRTRQGTTCDSIVYLHLTIDTTCYRPCKEGGVLINGLCWAECNVDEPGTFASTPEAWGMLYQWNRKKGWPVIGTVSDWDNSNPDGTNWETANDPCPKGWRVPHTMELNRLLDDLKVTQKDIQQNGVAGSQFIDNVTGNAIFFPETNMRYNETTTFYSDFYWSASSDYIQEQELSNDCAISMTLFHMPMVQSRNRALPIRCVTDWGERECEDIRRDTSVTICAKDLPYPFADTVFREGTVSGIYTFHRSQSVTGYDSIVHLHLTVQDIPPLEFFGEICQGGNYTENDFNLYAVMRDTIVRDTIPTQRGCDSVRILDLRVHPVYDTVVYDTVCQGDSYHGHGFTLTNAQPSDDGTSLAFHRTAQSIHGCDSVIHLYLFVGATYLFETEREICQGDTVMWRGKQYDKEGTYEEPFTTVHGCDSVYRLLLTVHPVYDTIFFGDICQGEGYNEDGFFVPSATKDTIVRQELKTRWGCDSVRTLYLTVHPVYDTIVRDTVCQGDAYYRHGVSISHAQPSGDGKPAMYRHTYPSVYGCDSTVTLFLTVHPISDTILYDAICRGDGYRNHGFSLDASQFPKEGTYSFSWKERNMHGCDSTIHLSLTVHPDYLFPRTEHICQGETFEFRDKVYDATGLYADTLATMHGCDSVYTLSLTVDSVYDVRLEGVLCEGEEYVRDGFHVKEPGTHVLHLRSVHGCDSTVTLTLTEEKKVVGSIGFLLEDCTKHGYGFEFSPSIPVREWVWDMGDGTAYRTEEGYHRYADSGTYRVLLRTLTDNGCGGEFLHVQRVPPYLDRVTVRADRQVVDEEYPTVRFRAEVLPGMECEWDFGDGTTGRGCETEHTYVTAEARVYEVTLRVTNEDGCITESTLDIEAVVFPKAVNTFSPNGDGINDVFMAGFRIEIMNRNGLKIYSGGNGWDGTYKGGEAKEDTYFYRVTFRTATGERTKTGYVNLIR